MMMTALLALALVSTPGPNFDLEIAPILARRCLDCHSGPEAKGKLDLSRRASALAGGEEGEAIVPGNPAESLLWDKVESGEMPPKRPMAEAEKVALRAWIASGASWGTDPIDPFATSTDRRAGRDWWSLQPIRRPDMPTIRPGSDARSPVDAFLLARLDREGIIPRPEADRRSLLRRLTFDLTGLPPRPEDVEEFEADPVPDAFERRVDRLLGSPEYGARWARWWLDLARFGESNGYEFDEFRPNAWRYRDWVVDALNRDLPFDEFARLQVAGDVLRPGNPGALAATGFLVAGGYDTVGQGQQSEPMRAFVRAEELEEIIGTVSQTFLGLTVHCARCHDHKFDPIRQAEYYRIASSLGGVRAGERPIGGSSKAYAVTPREPGAARIHQRGNPNQPGDVVEAGGVSALGGAEFGLAPDAPESDRRTKLAAWIASDSNPLFARVIVNRLWQAHFGVGLIETPSDFGFNGGQPSNRDLLDWLAAELPARGWSLKAIHRIIVTSAAYRRSTRSDPVAMARDSGNRLLWRKSPTRLEAEMVRDAMLAVSGQLDPRAGGPSFLDHAVTKPNGSASTLYVAVPPDGPGLDRRTLYRAWSRGAGAPCSTPSTAPTPRPPPPEGRSRPRRRRPWR